MFSRVIELHISMLLYTALQERLKAAAISSFTWCKAALDWSESSGLLKTLGH